MRARERSRKSVRRSIQEFLGTASRDRQSGERQSRNEPARDKQRRDKQRRDKQRRDKQRRDKQRQDKQRRNKRARPAIRRAARHPRLERLESRQLLTVMVDRLELLNDTGDAPDDLVTSDPTLTGHVMGDLTTGSVHLEFDHDGDQQAEGTSPVEADQTFRYDPRVSDPAFATREGPVALHYRPYRLDAAGQRIDEGWWSSFGFVLESPPPAAWQVTSFSLVEDTGVSDSDGRTTNPTVTGRVAYPSDPERSADGLLVELDWNGDGQAERTVPVEEDGRFVYRPTSLARGDVAIAARPLHWDADTGSFQSGAWSSLSFTYESEPAAVVTELAWSDPDSADRDSSTPLSGNRGIVLHGRLEGSAEAVADQPVQFDLDGDGNVDGTATSDWEGRFWFPVPSPGEGRWTARARGTRYDASADAWLFSAWRALELEVEPSVTPSLGDFSLVSATTDELGSVSAERPAFHGSVQGVPEEASVWVEWDQDGDGTADGQATVAAQGQFIFETPGLQPGSVTIAARAVAWDQRLGTERRSAWSSISFELTERPMFQAEAPRLELADGGAADASPPVTSNPTVFGFLDHLPEVNDSVGDETPSANDSAEQGGAGPAAAKSPRLTVELDFDGDQQFDAITFADESGVFRFVPPVTSAGPLTVAARLRYWDAARQQGHFGPWGQLDFVFEEPRQAPIPIERLALASDSGPSRDDLVTANPLVLGRLPAGSTPTGVVVQWDQDGDERADGEVFVADDGMFFFEPAAASPGQITLRARTVGWDFFHQAEVLGPWTSLTFTLQPEPAAAAHVVELSATSADENGVSPDSHVQGRIVNENALAGVTIEMDVDGDGRVDQSTTTDALGRFTAQVAGLADGSVTIHFRSREMDASTGRELIGDWTPLHFTLRRPSDVAPRIAQWGLVEDTGSSDSDGLTWDPRLAGSVEGYPAGSEVTVQFDHDADGVADGFALADNLGRFVYTPAGLDAGDITIRARTRWQPPSEAGQVSEWSSLSFVLESRPAQEAEVVILELARDTGSSDMDRSTSDPALRGVVQIPESLTHAAIVVELDLDRDGIPDAHVTADPQGAFTLTPAGLSPGVVSVRARATVPGDPDRQAGPWRELSFVYAENPDAAEATSLAVSLAALDDLRAAAERDYQAELVAGERNHARNRQVAEQQYDALVAEAVRSRDTGIAQANAAYRDATAAADAVYQQALADAAARLRDSAEVLPEAAAARHPVFVWPDAPPAAITTAATDFSLTPPSSPSLSEQDASPPDLSDDPVLADQLARARSIWSSALNAADIQRRDAQAQADATYRQAVQTAHGRYRGAVAAADESLRLAREGIEIGRDALDVERLHASARHDAREQRARALKAHASDYQAAVRAAQQMEAQEIATAQSQYDTAYYEANQRYFQLMSDPSLTQQQREEAERAFLQELADLYLRRETDIADARLRYVEVEAEQRRLWEAADSRAELTYQETIADADKTRAEQLAAQHQRERALVVLAEHDHQLALADARRQRTLELAAANQAWINDSAEAAQRYAQSLADADRDLAESQADSRLRAVERYARFDANPKSELQWNRANQEYEFAVSVAAARQSHTRALAAADRQRLEDTADRLRSRSEAEAEADYQRDVQAATQQRNLRLSASLVDEARTTDEASAWRQKAHSLAQADHTLGEWLASRDQQVAVSVGQFERDRLVALARVEADRQLRHDPARHQREEWLANHERDTRVARALHAGDMSGLDAREDRDESGIAAEHAYVRAMVGAERQRETQLRTAHEVFEQRMAVAEHDRRLALAAAQGQLDEQTAVMENAWRRSLTAASGQLDATVAAAAANRANASAGAIRDTLVRVARNHHSDVAAWSDDWQHPAAEYHEQLALAELQRVLATEDASLQYAQQVGTSQLDWTAAENNLAQNREQGRAAAYAAQVVTIVAAADQLATVVGAAQADYDLAVSRHMTDYDQDLLTANHDRRLDEAGYRAQFERTFATAGWNFRREEQSARLEEQLARRDAELQRQLGNLTADEYDQRLREAARQRDARLAAAEIARREAEAAAEVARLTSEAQRQQTWWIDVGRHTTDWTDSLGAAAEVLAGEQHQAGLQFTQSETLAGLQFAQGVAVAEQHYWTARAGAEAHRENQLAGVHANLDQALVTAAAEMEVGRQEASETRQLAELARYTTALRSGPSSLASHTLAYQQAVADTQLAWAGQVAAARDSYRRDWVALNQAHAAAANQADVALTAGLRAADVARATGAVSAESARAVAYAQASGQLTVAETRALLDQGLADTRAERQFQTVEAHATGERNNEFAAAHAAWVIALADAERTRHLAGESNESQQQFEAAREAANESWEQAARAADIRWADRTGAAIVGHAERRGDAEVARANAFGQAGENFAQAVGHFMTLYTAQLTGHEEQWTLATTRAEVNHQQALAQASGQWVAASADAARDLVQGTGTAHVSLATSRAQAEADYHLALATERQRHLVDSGHSPTSYPVAEARAYHDWLAAVREDYEAFARSTAEADARHQLQLASATAALDQSRSAAHTRAVQGGGNVWFTHASNTVAAWGAYERTLVTHENTQRESEAEVNGDFNQAYAEAARQRAVDGALAERQFLVDSAHGLSTAASARNASREIADARQDASRASADHTWVSDTRSARSQFLTRHNTANLALRTALAGFDQRYHQDLTTVVEIQQGADAQAEAYYAVAEFAAIGELRDRLATEVVTFQQAMHHHESLQRQVVHQAVGSPYSELQVELAGARLVAGQQQHASFLQWSDGVRQAQADYQQTVGDAYREHAEAVALSGADWNNRLAEAASRAELSRAQADHGYRLAYDSAVNTYTNHMNDARLDFRSRVAAARQEVARGAPPELLEAERLAAEAELAAEQTVARRDFWMADTAALNSHRLAVSQSDQQWLAAGIAADGVFADETAAIDAAFGQLEALAHATRQQTLIRLETLAETAGGQLLAAELASRAAAHDSAWLTFAAEEQAALHTRAENSGTALRNSVVARSEHARQFDAVFAQAAAEYRREMIVAIGSRTAERSATEHERVVRETTAEGDHLPVASQTAATNGPPSLPTPRPGYHESLEIREADGQRPPSFSLDAVRTEPLFTGPWWSGGTTAGRVREPLLEAGRLAPRLSEATGDPLLARHPAHLTADLSGRLSWRDSRAGRPGATVVLSVGELLALAAEASSTAASAREQLLPRAAATQLAISGLVLRDAPAPSDFSGMSQWLEAEKAYRQRLAREVMQQSSERQRELWFHLREAVARDYYAQRDGRGQGEHASIGAPRDLEAFDRRMAERRFQQLGFWQRRATLRHWQETTDQFWYGEFTESVTVEGTAGEIGLSLTGTDLPMDLRDLYYQATHWEWTWEHAGKTGLYTISLLPLVGVVKNAKHLEHVDTLGPLHRVMDRGASIDAASGTALGRQADESRLLLPLGGDSCFVAGTRVLVAVERPGEEAADMGLHVDEEFLAAARPWFGHGLLGLGAVLGLHGLVRRRRARRGQARAASRFAKARFHSPPDLGGEDTPFVCVSGWR